MTVINESGLYSAILRSRKAEAKRFKNGAPPRCCPRSGSTAAMTSPLPPSARMACISPRTDRQEDRGAAPHHPAAGPLQAVESGAYPLQRVPRRDDPRR
ncbi:hypothetical protein [Salinicola sp. NYA28a]